MSHDVPVMPPKDRLLALLTPDPTLLARVLLAMLGGAEWARGITGTWTLSSAVGDGSYRTLLVLWTGTDAPAAVTNLSLPDPFRDPAAAWELMVREEMGLERHAPRSSGSYVARWWGEACEDGYRYLIGPASTDARPAVSLAALHKYANGPLSALIRATLEKL